MLIYFPVYYLTHSVPNDFFVGLTAEAQSETKYKEVENEHFL
jgi:hypothetical protein